MSDDETPDALPPLYHACVANDLPLVARLLAEGASPNDGESVYHAAELNRRECLELLLRHGADLSGQSVEHGNTPLYFLAGYHEGDGGAADAVLGMTWLLEHGADPDRATSINRWNEPPESMASPEVERVLRARGLAP